MNKVWYNRIVNLSLFIVIMATFAMDWFPREKMLLLGVSSVCVGVSAFLFLRRVVSLKKNEKLDVCAVDEAITTQASSLPEVNAGPLDIGHPLNYSSKTLKRLSEEEEMVDEYLRGFISERVLVKGEISVNWVQEDKESAPRRRLTDTTYPAAA